MDQFLGWLTGLLAIVVPGMAAAPQTQFLGYVEADYVYVAASTPGTIEMLGLREGDFIEAGQVVAVLSHAQQEAAVQAAEARVAAAAATVDNLKTGSRTEEVDVIRASLAQAEAQLQQAGAQLALAQNSWTRSQELFAKGLIAKAKLDADQATHDSAQAAEASAEAAVQQLRAQLQVAELPARDAQLANAEAMLAAAQADAQRARSDLSDRTLVAPVSGTVDELYFAQGETAAAGVPLLSILPTDALMVKFYVGETERTLLHPGTTLKVLCDRCPDSLTATLDRLATDPQFTPPVIYSRDERNRMVFMAEARLSEASNLLPGQPVNVELLP